MYMPSSHRADNASGSASLVPDYEIRFGPFRSLVENVGFCWLWFPIRYPHAFTHVRPVVLTGFQGYVPLLEIPA